MLPRLRIALSVLLCRGTQGVVARRGTLLEIQETADYLLQAAVKSGKAPRSLVVGAAVIAKLAEHLVVSPLHPIRKDRT